MASIHDLPSEVHRIIVRHLFANHLELADLHGTIPVYQDMAQYVFGAAAVSKSWNTMSADIVYE